MRRIAVIGCGGSGKTTLANELGRRLEIPVVHIDSHYWRLIDGERVESTPEQWTVCHRELIAEDAWIIEGMKMGTIDERLARADTVIYLDVSTVVCLSAMVWRWIRYRNRDQPELGVYTQIRWEFVRWALSFRRMQRPVLLGKLAGFEGQTYVLRSRSDGRRFLATGTRTSASRITSLSGSSFPFD